MNVTQTATTPIDTAAPATFTCAQCPFARLIEDNRYCCQVSQTASDVKRGHWEATVSCFEALAKAEAEKTPEPVAEVEAAPIAKTDATAPVTPKSATPSTPAPAILSAKKAAPATSPTLAKTAAAAIGTDNEPQNRGDNGRGRVQPIAPKKLNLSLVAVKRITSDIPASNFDQFELEIAGELSLSIGGFLVPPVLVRDSSGYKVVAGHLQYHAAVLARQLNPKAGETIPVILLESENESAALAQLKMLRFAA
ncbi:hypothetical protein QUA54_28420 [Microcoleus sp. MOSTC5]|uniref:hypothetical protein n=1 Tax=Microcoleus sp. MOSTC5 TaxID=3055378 RepID=UPI002FD72872